MAKSVTRVGIVLEGGFVTNVISTDRIEVLTIDYKVGDEQNPIDLYDIFGDGEFVRIQPTPSSVDRAQFDNIDKAMTREPIAERKAWMKEVRNGRTELGFKDWYTNNTGEE